MEEVKQSILEEGLTIEKNGLVISNALLIKGKVFSRINCANTVRISETGYVKGEICANDLEVQGVIEGNIYAKGTVKLCSSCKVSGQIYYGSLEIEKGALIEGGSQKISEHNIGKFEKSGTVSALKAKIFGK